MTDPDSSYRPRSPDFSSLPSFPNTFNSNNSSYQPQPPYLASPLDQRASYDASPFFTSGYQPPVVQSRIPQQYVQQSHHYADDMARRSARLSAQAQAQAEAQAQAQAQADVPPPASAQPSHQQLMFDQRLASAPKTIGRDSEHTNALPPQGLDSNGEQPKPWAGIDVKTKFPVARIKRIMQADEEVGKVAQVTPIAVSKALELFMISLVTKAATEAQDRNSRRVTAVHLKQAVAKDEVLDFLADICSKVPDQAARKTEEDGSDHNEGKRKSGGGRRKKDMDSDDF